MSVIIVFYSILGTIFLENESLFTEKIVSYSFESETRMAFWFQNFRAFLGNSLVL